MLLIFSVYGGVVAPSIDNDTEEAAVAQNDLGLYVLATDVGIYVVQMTGGEITGGIGKLRWGLPQFGTIGILGYTPILISNVQRMNVRKAQ